MPDRDAETLYEEFRRRRAHGEDVDIESICAEHPAIAYGLRALHSLDGAPGLANGPGGDAHADTLAQMRAPEDPRADIATFAFSPGDEVGAYRIVSVLGEGGFAVVYRAEQLHPVRRIVALKAIKAGLDTRQVLARFEAERQALAVMSHTSIARVYDAGTTDRGRPYFVMEHVDGRPFTEHCDERRLPIAARLELFLQVCDAIQHAHQKGIIHRDLKPANVLVTIEGERPVPKVIDFGIAKALGGDLTDSSIETEAGQVIGTPAYMSPEQASGVIEDVDTRTDIYALGVMLYETLAGARPFDFTALRGHGLAAVQRVIREDDPPRPSARFLALRERREPVAAARGATRAALTRQLRGDLDWITMKALAKEPTARYASASELASDVRRHRRNEPVLAGPPSVLYRLRKVLRRRRRTVATIAIVSLAVILTGWIASTLLARRAEIETEKESLARLAAGEDAFRRTSHERAHLARARAELDAATRALETWRPIWQRGDETTARAHVAGAELALEASFAESFRELTRALDLAASDSATARRALLTLDLLRDDLDRGGASISLGELLFREFVIAGRSESGARGTFALSSSPAGAAVYCFRFVEHESRLVPLAYDPRADRVVGEYRLRVDRVFDPQRAFGTTENGARVAFLPGDTWRSIDRKAIGSRSELARALAGQPVDRALRVDVDRDGARLALDWVPFPSRLDSDPASGPASFAPGELADIRLQLGLTFEAQPLEFPDSARIGETSAGAPLGFELAAGSWLVVLRRDGHETARVPLVSPRDVALRVDLVPHDGLPPGFVHVPTGPARLGGHDPDVLQNLPYEDSVIPALLFARHEVSAGEWLEFVRERADPDGETHALCESIDAELPDSQRGGEIAIVPAIGSDERRSLIERRGGRWELADFVVADSPVQGVSFLAALEFADWKTRRDPRFSYRLPRDDEWERAARGADGRTFVWGDLLVWSFCRSDRGLVPEERVRFPDSRGAFPIDESVFGIRDLTGSVVEFAVGRPAAGKRYRSCRGGDWSKSSEYRFRSDARFGVLPESTRTSAGVRLVAALKQDAANAR